MLTPAHRRLIEIFARRAYANWKSRREQVPTPSTVAPPPPRRVVSAEKIRG